MDSSKKPGLDLEYILAYLLSIDLLIYHSL